MLKNISILGKVAAIVLAVGLVSTDAAAKSQKIGILMPSQNQARWYHDGKNLKLYLKNAGFDVELFHGGDDDINLQLKQVKRLLDEDYGLMIIAPIDGTKFTEALKPVKQKGIPVISYDRLLMNTDAVSYYITFDNLKVGRMQGLYIVDKLNLDYDFNPKYIEFVAGAPTDNNAKLFFEGAMEVLKPYLDEGKLICASGETKFEQVTTEKWNFENAAKRLDGIINQYYLPEGGKHKLDAIYCSSDGLAKGAILACDNNRFPIDRFPVITSQDCSKPIIDKMIEGKIDMSILKNPNILAEQTVEMCRQILSGSEVEVNDHSYNNGKMTVDTYLCEPRLVTKDKWQKILIDELKIYKPEDFENKKSGK